MALLVRQFGSTETMMKEKAEVYIEVKNWEILG